MITNPSTVEKHREESLDRATWFDRSSFLNRYSTNHPWIVLPQLYNHLRSPVMMLWRKLGSSRNAKLFISSTQYFTGVHLLDILLFWHKVSRKLFDVKMVIEMASRESINQVFILSASSLMVIRQQKGPAYFTTSTFLPVIAVRGFSGWKSLSMNPYPSFERLNHLFTWWF